MPPRARRPRQNPLIPTGPDPAPAFESRSNTTEAPICGQHWPEGWGSLPAGADHASCEHGEWSTTEGLTKRAAAELNSGPEVIPVERQPYSAVIDGVTTDGTPVKVTIRPGEPALISLSDVQLGSVAISPPDPAWSPLTPAPAPSPFRPKAAPEPPAEQDATDLDTGEDVMFMPSGG